MNSPSSENPKETRPFWSLDPAEQRLLWITFAGGLGSIIAGVLLAAAAVAVVRFYGGAPHGWPLAVTGALTLGLVFFFTQGLRRHLPFTTLSAGVGLTYCLMLWLGLAVGIH